jgi:hypothetical protein
MQQLSNLRTILNRKHASIVKQANDLAKETARSMLVYLANATPVDTSRAVSNWRINFNSPKLTTIEAHFPGDKGSTKYRSIAETLANGEFMLGLKPASATIYITNNLDYIGDLNDGKSRQAMAGWVDISYLVGRNVIKRYKFKL